jgi:hypothetical protein
VSIRRKLTFHRSILALFEFIAFSIVHCVYSLCIHVVIGHVAIGHVVHDNLRKYKTEKRFA